MTVYPYRRLFWGLSALFFVAGGLFAGGQAEPITEPADNGDTARQELGELQDLTIASLRGPTGIGMAPYLGGDPVEGRYARVSTEVVADPSVMVARLSSGEADVGMLPSNVVAQLANRGIPVQIAAVTLWGVLYVVGPDDGVRAVEDLSGRVVHAVGRGATPDIVLRHLLSEAGMDAETDVDLRFQYSPVELTQLVIAGEIDRAVLPEPFVTQALSRRNDLAVNVDLQEAWRNRYGDSYPQTAIVVRSDVAVEYPQAMEEALALVESGWSQILADPEAAGETVAATDLGVPAPVVERALPRLNARYVPVSEAQAALEEYFAVLFAFDPRTVGGSVPGPELYWRP